MYEERNNFSLRNVVLQFLLVILFVFIMIWLFPTKSYMDDNYVTKDELIQQLQSIYGRNFASNVESMRDAAKGYFTNERMPQKVGESVTLTLGQMLEKKLVLEFVDSNGNKCDANESYVKITKMDNEYQLKVQLTCTDYSDYIIDYVGCYDYCDECEEPEEETTPTKPSTKPEPATKKYKYQYRLTTQNKYSDWTEWSNWSTTKVTANTLTQVETENRQEISGYTDKNGIVGYKTETYVEYETETYTDYETETYTEYETVTKEVEDGETTTLVSTVNPTYSKGYYTDWKYAGTTSSTTGLYTTDTVRYTETSTERYLDCEDKCKYVTRTYYTVEKRSWVSGTPSCPEGYVLEGISCNKYETTTDYKTVTEEVAVTKTREVPVTKTREVAVTKTREVPVYGTVQGDAIYKTVTYYRYRTRTQTSFASTDYKMSTSKNDKTLLDKGYELTGYYEEV